MFPKFFLNTNFDASGVCTQLSDSAMLGACLCTDIAPTRAPTSEVPTEAPTPGSYTAHTAMGCTDRNELLEEVVS